MRNQVHQLKLQIQTYGRAVPLIEDALANGVRPLLELVLKEQAREIAEAFQLGEDRFAERFRLVRFGPLERLIQERAEPLPETPEPPHRQSLDAG